MKRKITVYSTQNKAYRDFYTETTESELVSAVGQALINEGKATSLESDVTTWGDFSDILESYGYSIESLHATESVNRTDLVQSQALLPQGDFVLFLRPKKTKSGGPLTDGKSFKELRDMLSLDQVLKDNVCNYIATNLNKNYTRASSIELAKAIEFCYHGDIANITTTTDSNITNTCKSDSDTEVEDAIVRAISDIKNSLNILENLLKVSSKIEERTEDKNSELLRKIEERTQELEALAEDLF